jgi:large repetitive protein
MQSRLVRTLMVALVVAAAFAGVARALDFDDEDPHPPRAEIGLLYHYEIGTHAGCIPHHVVILSGQLPPGLKLTQIGYQTALVDGIATEAGTFSAWLAVHDCENRSAETLFTFEVWDRRYGIDTKIMPAASTGSPYSFTLATWGVSSNSTWEVTSGALPAGLTLSKEGTIAGTPTSAGDFSFVVKVTGVAKDFSGTRVDSRVFTLSVAQPLAARLSRGPLEVGVPARTAVVASGGRAPFSWTATAGLPAGLAVTSDGTVAGTPKRAGTYRITLRAVDAAGTASDVMVMLIVRARLTIATTRLQPAAAGRLYRRQLAARGGVGGLRWTAAGIPRGLKIGATTGRISGIPTSEGRYDLTVRVRDALGAVSRRRLTLTVH